MKAFRRTPQRPTARCLKRRIKQGPQFGRFPVS